ncbi:hypothetical protein SAMN04490248_10386 [Salinihabitans flavidus]|uniref:DUF2332 domain-containing protein n=1 Tax=Salinihabitans flavidus TaxID=569882 RepID=A0A1H8NB66_9RHOB|nr:DUF2332 family protein [Salinihabitans flavidus]SEO26689.1 hypothetical protein SAMN04490248_10386 [Salinihabitans flavidus]
MSEGVRVAFVQQGRACASLGSAFMGRLMPLIGERLGENTTVGARCLAWQGDVGPSGQSVPLRLAGALHALVLDGSAPGLAAVYPPHSASDYKLWAAVEDALQAREARILTWLDRAPQTNEVRRAAAVIAGLWWALGEIGVRPVVLSEMGASAGLNLALDRYCVAVNGSDYGPADPAIVLTPEWRGHKRPDPHPITVKDRSGVDLAPLDPANPSDRLRLLAYIWPDQPDRLARTRAAIAVASVRPDAGDAAPWLARRLSKPRLGALHVVYTTIAAQYFPDATRKAIAETLQDAGMAASAEAPLLHLSMEADGSEPGAGLTATLWSGGAPRQARLGRAHFHVDWIEWFPEAAERSFFPLLES